MSALSNSNLLKILLSAAAFLLLAGAAGAGTVPIAWDPVDHPALTGYRVYKGTESGTYTHSFDIGTDPQTVLTGLADCTTHFVAIKARGSEDALSEAYSNEFSGWPSPRINSVASPEVEIGSQHQLVIAGANFKPGAVVAFSQPAIVVDGVSVTSCYQLVATVTVGAAATPGAVAFEVINPDQSFAAAAGLLQLIEGVDEDSPVITQLEAGVVGSTMVTITWTTDELADGRVFYRMDDESTFQRSALDSDPALTHAIALNGLRPDTAYEFYVTSSDLAGNPSISPMADFTTLANGFDYLRFEAETVEPDAPFEIGDGGDSFGGAWLALSPGTPTGYHDSPAGTHDLGFHLSDPGTYHFWYRMYAAGEDSDGFLEEVDGSGFDYIYPSDFSQWRWVEGRSYSLQAGQHTLTLGGHEAGARIDRILITNDAGFQPGEEPGDDSTPPSGVADLHGTEGDTINTLAWVNPGNGDLGSVVVRYRTDGVLPTSPVDGLPLLDQPAVAGATGSLEHTGLANGATYYYSVFVIDTAENVSVRHGVALTPNESFVPLAAVENLRRTDTR